VSEVVVLNASYEPLQVVTLKHAIRMLVRKVAVVEEADGTFGPFPRPLVLRLVRYVRMTFRYARNVAAYSRNGVIRRDKGRCAYCGHRGADTMDHVLPRSRGGGTGWLNAVAAHRECNRAKGDRTPEEAGMPLLWQPWKPTRVDLAFSAVL
jgi:5-methylcytosine-specific restriction endonuclease McrA